jgi:uncharacterized protein (UPF0332 family)
MRQFAASEWERAERTLVTADHVVDKDPESAASRAFYAAFHAMSALFALRGLRFATHTGVRTAIHRDLVRTGQCPPELGKAYDALFDLRQSADYGDLRRISSPEAREAVESARRILEFVRNSCPELAADGI